MEQLNLNVDTPATGRHFPIEGRPFALVMAELWEDGYGHIVS
jgi:hypothetical protein